MARGHHYRPTAAHMGDRAMRADGGTVPARAEGGKIGNSATESRIPEEREGTMTSYTNTPNNVEEESEGKKRKAGGGVKRARGGAMKHIGMEGEKTKHRRLDRPGRQRGGGVGATDMPLSSAARTRPAGAHKADNDELSNA